jgi:hypothetical protein
MCRMKLQILQAVRLLLEDPAKWTIRTRARDYNGDPVHPTAPTAICWCLEGAVCLVAKDTNAVELLVDLYALLDAAAVELYPVELRIDHVHFDTGQPEEPIWPYVAYEPASYANDVLGYEATLSILDKAIELAGTR